MTDAIKQQIHDLRLQGAGYKAIAAVIGISRDTVRGFCKKHGLEGGPKAVPIHVVEQGKSNLICPCCSQDFKKNLKGRSRRFCSEDCRRKWWNEHPEIQRKSEAAIYSFTCRHCGKPFRAYGDKKRKYCCHACYIKARFWSEDELAGVGICT